MLDCGMHMGYNDERRFPDFSFINQGNLTQHLSCVIISHFHLDHCGALPYMTEMVGYNGPIYMTMPTKAICPILLEDYRRITVDKKGETNFFTSTMVKDCMKKVTTVGLHETVQVDDEMEIKAYYAGHVLGAAMFLIRVGSQSVVYTKIKQTFVHRNMFDFKHIKPFDRAYIDNPGPMVVFATPGMLHSGLSVQIFRKWAPNENNMLIMPGYCVAGTVGHKVISGAKKIEFENRQIVEVKMSVQYMSFSAHADAKGIMQLIQHCEPSKVMLVHGEASKMEFLKKKITQELGKECLMPANGETVSFETPITVPVDVSLDLLKKQIYSRDANGIGGLKRKSILHGMLVMNNNKIRLMEPEEAMQEVGVVPHQVRFTSTLRIEDPTGAPASRLTDVIFSKIKSLLENHNVQLAPDCSITVASVLIKVDVGEDDTKSICVSWGYQDEELGKFLLPAIKKWSSETKG
ncbi:integrator complex subunit 11-like [Uloborus diversus]|uniref:integrator complex subunit 11-like n=1 Tax=Uloborus diversus TaxID=327109 RepID=UPI00240A7FC9|nr:integrator complex subunit 11-like [Uloborus diversus]